MPLPRKMGQSTLERDMGRGASYTGIVNFTPLRVPLTHTSFDGESFSDTGATKIENSSWSDTIPADAVALLIQIRANDSAEAVTADLHFSVGPSATYYYALVARPIGGTDVYTQTTGPCPCTNGDIWYAVNASGAGTLDCVLRVWGWWI